MLSHWVYYDDMKTSRVCFCVYFINKIFSIVEEISFVSDQLIYKF